ncbi:MAG: DUF1015 domain-containing protein [Tractidigestivibacter sp.]|jgi:uncharacterized protein (DUF1015 family)|uniref:DUF1015 domain-containing protein n=1 Tax=Tractidigestivibacter sp. TaxID=2847320 RepID=UPI003D8F981C
MRTKPFICYRPAPEKAAGFASLPYDVYTRESAAKAVAERPKSFLAIDRAETAFGPDQDMHAPEVYAKAASILSDRVMDATLVRDGTPCYYLYRLDDGAHQQTGIVAACAIDDYETGVIKRHELTRPADEKDRVDHITATGCQTGPVFLAYRDNEVLSTIVGAAMGSTPLYDFTDAEGTHETVWRVAREAAIGALQAMLELVPSAYIADGHHRAAAAAAVRKNMIAEGKIAGDGTAEADYVLAVLFPESQLNTLPYDRVVSDLGGMSPEEFLSAIKDHGFVAGEPSSAAVRPSEPGHFGLYLDGAWRELSFVGKCGESAVSKLDVSILQENLLSPVLGIADPREDPRIGFVGGHDDAADLEALVPEGGLALAMRATPVSDMMAVADEGGIMPPKSTWFEPKLRSGLFIRPIGVAAEKQTD